MLRVKEIRGRFSYEGKAYGPFQPSEAKPYTEVPKALALALSLPLYQGGEASAVEGQALDAHADADETLNHVAEAKQEEASQEEEGETPLPADFPMRSALLSGGYRTLEALRRASDKELNAVDGIGDKSLGRIREALK